MSSALVMSVKCARFVHESSDSFSSRFPPEASLIMRSSLLVLRNCLSISRALSNESFAYGRKYHQRWASSSLQSIDTLSRKPLNFMSSGTLHMRYGQKISRSVSTQQTDSDTDDLVLTNSPHDHPLATIGEDELSEEKRYWRKRQAEAKPIVYVREVDSTGRAHAVGKRKSSSAQVWIMEGIGNIKVNGKDWVDYFPRPDHRVQIARPLALLGRAQAFDVVVSVIGGGNTGQAEAIRHGIARAMQKWDPQWRGALKKDGLLTRDSRIVESKKYGRKKARKSFQWVKR